MASDQKEQALAGLPSVRSGFPIAGLLVASSKGLGKKNQIQKKPLWLSLKRVPLAGLSVFILLCAFCIRTA